MVFRMPSDPVDPSGNTQAFRAFTEKPEPESAPAAPKTALLLAAAVAAVVVIILVAWLALS